MMSNARLFCLMLTFFSVVSAFDGTIDRAFPRTLQESTVVTTSACDHVRTEPFTAKLELEYLYLVETLGPLEDLRGLENINNRAILDSLRRCDEEGFPQYGLELLTDHEYAEQGFCIPRNPENVCSIIRGTANIYLDSEVTEARDIAYTALDEALADPTFVVLFEPNVVHSRFLGSVQENVILVPIEAPSPVETTTTPSSIKIAIAISSVVFVVASIFSFGFLRRQTKLNACRQQADLQRQQRRKSGRELRRYFQTLDSDDGTVDGPVHQMTTDQDCRSVTWSDLTSDSGSVQSIISRTTSRLHKIEEEPDHEKHAEVEATWDAQEMPLSSHYTAAYVAHKSRLREIVKDACSEDRDDGEERITPKMEDSFPTSFGSDDLLFPDAFQSPTGRSEQASDLSSLSNYYTPKSGKTHAGFISEVASELTMDEHLGSNVFNGSYESATDQYPELNVSIGSAGWAVIENPELNVSTGSPLRGLNLNRSMDTNDSGASLQRWLTRLLLELNMSQQVKRIEL